MSIHMRTKAKTEEENEGEKRTTTTRATTTNPDPTPRTKNTKNQKKRSRKSDDEESGSEDDRHRKRSKSRDRDDKDKRKDKKDKDDSEDDEDDDDDDDEDDEKVNWNNKTVIQLKRELKRRKIDFDKASRKSDLVTHLEEDDKEPASRQQRKRQKTEKKAKKKKSRGRGRRPNHEDDEKVTAEKKKYKQIKDEVAKLKCAELTTELKANHQKMGGKKKELIKRVTDGRIYGALPKCPKCHGGYLTIKYKSAYGHSGQGEVRCPGHVEDNKFLRCHYHSEKVQRANWKIPDD